jgi:hypothetical protein
LTSRPFMARRFPVAEWNIRTLVWPLWHLSVSL